MNPLPLEIDVHTVKQLLDAGDDVCLIDCREPDEHATTHIPQAALVPMSELPERLGELGDTSRRIVIHCHHGGRSMRVTRWLREQGYDAAQSMAGGIDAWSQQIDPSVPRY